MQYFAHHTEQSTFDNSDMAALLIIGSLVVIGIVLMVVKKRGDS